MEKSLRELGEEDLKLAYELSDKLNAAAFGSQSVHVFMALAMVAGMGFAQTPQLPIKDALEFFLQILMSQYTSELENPSDKVTIN